MSPIETGYDQDFRAQFETNLWGVYNVSKAAIPVLREQGGALIMQFSSMGGRVGSPRHRFPPGGQIRDRRIQPRAAGRDRSVRHLGDRPRTERFSHRRGRVVDDRPAHPRGVRPRYSPGVVRPVALRPGPGPSGRNTRPGREASRHSPQSASWSELDGGLDTARQSAPRRRSQLVSRAGQPISARPSLSSFSDI